MAATATVSATSQPALTTRPEPTQDGLIAQLRADLTAERAINLRMSGYLDEVLGAEMPDHAVPGWEAEDFWAFWDTLAVQSLRDDDMARRGGGEADPIPVMEPPPATDAAQAATRHAA